MAANRDSLARKYLERLNKEVGGRAEELAVVYEPTRTSNYLQFKKELLPPPFTLYEKLCNTSERVLKIKQDAKTARAVQEQLELSHIHATAAGTFSFSILASLALFMVGSLLGFILFRQLFIVVFMMMIGGVSFIFLSKLPDYLANTWRLRASNQMVHCVFYMVTYMRHTSNLELAVRFAADHLSPPISLDLKKVLWDVESEKFDTIQESLDYYLETWKKWNGEFIEAVHMLEGSLLESSEERRLGMVDKALDVMLQETYEKMLHYAHNLKNPLTTVYMLGIILPILGLVILPMVVSLMTKNISPILMAMYLALLYNVTLPIGVFLLSKSVLSTRPTGYGQTDISEENPELKRYRNIILPLGRKEIAISPLMIAFIVGAALVFVGIIPVLLGSILPEEFLLHEPAFDVFFNFKFLEYRHPPGSPGLIGPYGLGAAVLSLLVPLGLGVGLGLYYKLSSQNVLKLRDAAKKLEQEFAGALFQLGNRLADGLPAEVAFAKVADVMKGSISGDFFQMVSANITRMGMSLEDALFNRKQGALLSYPSAVIESSMKVLVESSRKGPKIAALSVINISRYIKEIHRVNERLRDLMADIVGDMKQQINFLAPVIAGIVVGITSMIILILGKLSDQIATLAAQSGAADTSALGGIGDIFGVGVPTYYFQIIVGIYVVEIVYILTVLTNGIENGSDKLAERYSLGANLIKSTALYIIISLVVIVMFNALASSILNTGVF